VRVREDTTSPAEEPETTGPAGSATVTGEAGAEGQSAGSVRDEIEQNPGPALIIPSAVTGGILAFRRFYRRASDERERLAARWWWLPGRVFGAITMAPALLAIALLVPGTGMLLAGRLLPVPVLIIFVPLAVALCYFGMRGLPVQWPLFGKKAVAVDASGSPAPESADDGSDVDGRRVGVPVAALLATVAIATGFGVWQAALRSEQVFGVGDPSVYLQYGYWIAKHGTARIPTLASSFGTSGGLVFSTSGFYTSGGVLTPAFLPGLPLVLAAGTWMSGLGGAMMMPAVLGGCAVLSFGGVVGRLAGGRWAPVGALVLAVSLPEIYVSRTPFSEPLVQVLLFGGLCMFIDSFGVLGGGMALAGLGGLALGLTVLTWIGSLSILLPAFPVLAWLFVARRRQAAPFGIGLFLGIAIGLAAALTVGRSYLSTVSSELHVFGLAAAAFGLATALIAPLAVPEVRARVWRVFTRRLRAVGLAGEEISLPSLAMIVEWAVVALPVVALVVLAFRPSVQTVVGQTNPVLVREVAALQRMAGLPVDGRKQYYEQSFSWVLWYIGVPAVLLACAGASLLGRRLVRAVLDGSSSIVAARLWALPFLIIAWSVGTVLWDPAVAPWQPWASHRLVPVVLPGLVLFAVWVSSRLTVRAAVLGAGRPTVTLVAICCALALAIPPLVTSLNPGIVAHDSVGRYSSGLSKLVSRVRLRGVGGTSAYRGSVPAATSLCNAMGPSASVVFVNASTAAEFASTVRVLCGLPTASMAAGSSSASVEQVATAIERTGRRPVLLGASRASVSLFGIVPHVVLSLHTTGDAEVLTGPPAENWPVTYTVWMASPLQ
jgi:hypothetical protein